MNTMASSAAVPALPLGSMRSRITRGGSIALILLLGLVLARPAAAQEEQKFAIVELSALRTPGSSLLAPIEVSVVSQRAIEAVLVVEHQRENLDWRFDLAIPANSEVSEVFLVPSLRGLDLQASLVVDDEVIDRTNLGFGGNLSDNAVGVFGLDARAQQVPLDPPVGSASIIPLDDLSLLNGLDTVVTSAAGLGLLDNTELRELIAWTSAGHQLIIAGEPGSADRFLPWTARTPVVWADAGIIRYVGTDWQRSVAPGVTSAGEHWQLVPLNNFGPGPSHQEILSDAGFRIPGLGPLASLLLVYVAVAGPIAFLVLRSRGKQKMLWVVLPALSALFTFGVLGAGGLLNRGRGDAHAQIVEVSSAGRSVTESFVLADDGEQSVDLPSGWQILSTSLGGDRFEGGGGSAVEIERTRTTNTLNFDIDPGSAGTATVVGFEASSDGGLRVEDVSARNGKVSATLVNGTDVDLVRVVAMVGDGLVDIGRVDSGQSISVEIPGNARNGVNSPEIREWDINSWFDWNGADLSNPEVTDGPINASAWVEWRASRVGTGAPAGVVTAVGWTRDGTGVVLNGEGRTAFVARQAIERIDGPAGAGMVRSIPVGSPVLFGEFQVTNEAVHQILRPAGADTSELAFSVPADVSEVSVWTEDGFRVFAIQERNVQTVRLPEDLWVDDTMWIRTRHNGFGGESGVQLVIVSATDRTLEPLLLEAGERSERAILGNDFGPDFGPEFQGGVFETLSVGPEPTVINGFVEGGLDQYEFEVTAGDAISVFMQSIDANVGFGPNSPFVELYGPTGGLVGSAGDVSGNGAALDHLADETGWYRVEASLGFTGGPPFGEYELTLSVAPRVEG
jgi:hypothetical protein